jgi:transporter family protein
MPKWLVYSILTLLLWGGWGVVGKKIGDRLTSAETQAFSTIGLLPLIVVLGARRKGDPGPRVARGVVFAFLSGLLAGGGNIAYYHALSIGGAASTVTPLTALYPVVTILLAVLFLREKISRVQFAGIVIALCSIYLFNPLSSGSDVKTPWLAYTLVPIGLWGVSAFLQKVSRNDVSSELSTIAFWLAFVPIAGVIFLTQPVHWKLPAETWAWVLLLGVFFGLGNLTLLAAYGSGGKASVVTPLSGLYSMVTIPLAIFYLGEKIGMRDGCGIALALVSVVALSYEKRPAPSEPVAELCAKKSLS